MKVPVFNLLLFPLLLLTMTGMAVSAEEGGTSPVTPSSPATARDAVVSRPVPLLPENEKMTRRIARSMVSIVTPLGKATGFFIDSRGYILTTSDAIIPGEAELEKIKHKKKLLEQIIALEQKRLQTIRQKMSLLMPGAEKEQFKRLSSEKKEELFKSLAEKQELEDFLAGAGKLQRNLLAEIHVVSAGGERHELVGISTSPSRNLALLQVKTTDRTYRPLRPRPIPLHSDDSVFAAGYSEQSPLPLQSGKTSGRQLVGERDQICSDLQIQKEDRGGPLLDRWGNVCGVNTAASGDGEERGCAIPISEAFNEFCASITLQIVVTRKKKIVANNDL